MIAGAEATRSATWLLTQLVVHHNCRHWQLYRFATVDLRVLLPTRHAPQALLPPSNPDRPQNHWYSLNQTPFYAKGSSTYSGIDRAAAQRLASRTSRCFSRAQSRSFSVSRLSKSFLPFTSAISHLTRCFFQY